MAETVTSPAQTGIRPQSLIFTLYGDYIHARADRIGIRNLIRLLAHFGVSEQAVRTTVSRMTERGWLEFERVGSTSYYIFTARAQQTIEEGKARIFTAPRPTEGWNHCWHLVTYSIPETQRRARDQFRRELGWLGYGMLTNTVWVSPYNQRARVEQLAAQLNIQPAVQTFSAQSETFLSCAELAARCWHLDDLNTDYASFLDKHAPAYEQCRAHNAAASPLPDSECFTRRLLLIHEYRAFPYRDPYLPLELLPADWRGVQAAELFRNYHALLAAQANQYFDSVMANSLAHPARK